MMGRVVTAEAQRFMVDCLKAVGTASKAAEQQAELLIQADRFGHPSHGLNRLEMYVNDIKSGACEPNNEPKILKETEATAWVDANNVLGATASHFGMDLAIKKALKTGVGWVSVKGSNHFGMAGFWAQKAADKGLIGMAYTNTSPLLAPTRSKEAALGTNPIACVAPASQNESFYLDMATTTVSVGKIEMQRRKGESLPFGWAQGPDGNETTDAELAFKTSCLMPLGGGELTSGYKGFGLAAMVELFCGVLGGANYGHHVRSWSHSGTGGPANLGHCFVAVNPECFAPCFGDRLADCITHWRQMEPAMKAGTLMPLGGSEQSSGYKGFGLGAVVDLLSGVLAGAHYAHHVPKWTPDLKTEANIGQTFVAVDHKCFAPGFEKRVSDCISYWRKMKPADPRYPVLAPGDLEKMSSAEVELTGILTYIVPLLEAYDKLAIELKVKPLQRMKAGE